MTYPKKLQKVTLQDEPCMFFDFFFQSIPPICSVYVRRKKNRSGSISVVVVSKQSGGYREVHVVGVNSIPATIEQLHRQGLLWIKGKNRLALFLKTVTGK